MTKTTKPSNPRHLIEESGEFFWAREVKHPILSGSDGHLLGHYYTFETIEPVSPEKSIEIKAYRDRQRKYAAQDETEKI